MVGNTRKIQVDSDTEYTLPGADGSSGHFLKTNGSGVTSWVAQTGATYFFDDQTSINDHTPSDGDVYIVTDNSPDFTSKTLQGVTIIMAETGTSFITLGSATNVRIYGYDLVVGNTSDVLERCDFFMKRNVTFNDDSLGFKDCTFYCKSFTLDDIDSSITDFDFSDSYIRCNEGEFTIGTGTQLTEISDCTLDINGGFVTTTGGVYLKDKTRVTASYASGSEQIKFANTAFFESKGHSTSASTTNNLRDSSDASIVQNVPGKVPFVIQQMGVWFPTNDTPCAFLATVADGQTHVTDTNQTVVFDTETYDDGGDFDTSTGYFTAPCDGIYSFSACVTYDDDSQWSAQDYMRVYIDVGGTPIMIGSSNPNSHSSLGFASVSGSVSVKCDAGDDVFIEVYQNSDVTLEFSDGLIRTNFSGHLVKRLG